MRDSFSSILDSQIQEIQIDSDSLGTFSGEIERQGTMLDALRAKVKLAKQNSHERFILVSEGSFGPASGIGFMAQDHELLMTYDSLKDVEIVESQISLNTNFSSQKISSESDLISFMGRIGFGSHGLILHPDSDPKGSKIYKGLTTTEGAKAAFHECLTNSKTGIVTAITDMRANFNPTRIECIKQCAFKLARRLNTPCPRCQSGGFGVTESLPGLPCGLCSLPTRLVINEKYRCPFCAEVLILPRADGVTSADPSHCEWCNP